MSAPRAPTLSPGAGAAGRAPPDWVVSALIGLLCLIWGSTWIVIRSGLRDLPPFTSAGVRFVIAAAVVSALVPLLRPREGGAAPSVRVWGVVGAVNFGLSYAIVYWAETRLPSAIAAVLWSSFPMMMAISGHLFLPGERLRGPQWIGFAVGFLGVVLLFLTDLRSFGPEGIPSALVLCASPLVSAVGTTVLKRYGSGASSVLVNRNAMWTGALLLLLAAALTERGAPVSWTRDALGSIAYLALIGTVVTFTLYFWLLRHAPAYKLSLIAYVTPPIALFLGWAAGGEPVTAFTLAGTALILCGVGLVARGRARPGRGALAGPTARAADRTRGPETTAEMT